MSVYNYKKYKVSLKSDSQKTQGLRAGDIVRRQYFDGRNIIYSLMCVLDCGIDKIVENDEIKEQSYFIGALLEGDAPTSSELLDFVRITSLFDTDRSGALYLTASDSNSPFMDVIDGAGKEKSLCWPVSIEDSEYIDAQKQYIIDGKEYAIYEYLKEEEDNNRICHITKSTSPYDEFIGLKQDFYQYIANPNRVVVSYKVKASRNINIHGSIGYSNGVKLDGEFDTTATEKWQYKLHVVTIEWSGRHLRTLRLNLNDNLATSDEVWISDLNIILLSDISSYKDASKIRIGKMNGIVDPVFGPLEGYGGYLQKLYASKSAYVSGTLTAGDENGFGSTFYAGRIHRNAFINSLQVNFTSYVDTCTNVINPTGIGKIYTSGGDITTIAQNAAWLKQKKGERYCFSCWIYAYNVCNIGIIQNGHTVGTCVIDDTMTHKWFRQKISFDLYVAARSEPLLITLSPGFSKPESDDNTNIFLFTAPQLEAGGDATQYQPTDGTLNITDEYGAWFSRGGIGGTIQNPLLQLNYDGKGGIGTQSKSLLFRQDGSGYLANMNINWDKTGKVTFGDQVTLNWDNLGQDTKDELTAKSIKIIGGNQFNIIENSTTGKFTYSPQVIDLKVSCIGFNSLKSNIKWYFINEKGGYVELSGENSLTLTISPEGVYWLSSGMCQIKCVILFNQTEYSDTILIQKNTVEGYKVVVTSSQGELIKNGFCDTTLYANVYHNGALISKEDALYKFMFTWKKFDLNGDEILDWNDETDIHNQSIKIVSQISSQQKYMCEISVNPFIIGQSLIGINFIGE